ncbi:MAG: hypothetical protein A2W22_01910 [Candidatus Levybacteria bacterium RBG_16_35_11]|nr:MAG: hypothetical protein A2W22_01910 [Candidatus Levybacteria bacterium RBG_16_35_11]
MTNKDIAVREIITKLIEPDGISLNRIGDYKYESNGKKMNIKTVSDKGLDRIWVDVAINDLKDMDFIIYCWFNSELTYICSYIIPSYFLRDKLEKHGKKNKKGTRYHFSIKVRDVLHLDKEHKYPIKEYKNNFSILK